jgi:hypothetical protein
MTATATPPAPTKMDPTIKAKWLEALRSGQYEQGHDALHDPEKNTFCCLGVLSEVVRPGCFSRGEIDPAHPYPPNDLLRVAGLQAHTGGHDPDEMDSAGCSWEPLWKMNDGYNLAGTRPGPVVPKADFARIADYIEENL